MHVGDLGKLTIFAAINVTVGSGRCHDVQCVLYVYIDVAVSLLLVRKWMKGKFHRIYKEVGSVFSSCESKVKESEFGLCRVIFGQLCRVSTRPEKAISASQLFYAYLSNG